MPKENPAFRELGGDAPGFTNMGFDQGADIEVSQASYKVNYGLRESMLGLPMSCLKKGFVPGGEPGSDDCGSY